MTRADRVTLWFRKGTGAYYVVDPDSTDPENNRFESVTFIPVDRIRSEVERLRKQARRTSICRGDLGLAADRLEKLIADG